MKGHAVRIDQQGESDGEGTGESKDAGHQIRTNPTSRKPANTRAPTSTTLATMYFSSTKKRRQREAAAAAAIDALRAEKAKQAAVIAALKAVSATLSRKAGGLAAENAGLKHRHRHELQLRRAHREMQGAELARERKARRAALAADKAALTEKVRSDIADMQSRIAYLLKGPRSGVPPSKRSRRRRPRRS